MEIRRYAYSYETLSTFAPAVGSHYFKLRMVPCQNDCQRIVSQQLVTEVGCAMQHAFDGWGNAVQYGQYLQPHSRFRVSSSGVVECRRYALYAAGVSHLWLCPSALAGWDESLRQWASWQAVRHTSVWTSDRLQMVHSLMQGVHDYLTYQRFVTDNTTTAVQVFHLQKGVCQDYAHLMIAACRSIGVPARYVNGMVIGEGETHAWVEVYVEGVWYALDPTRNIDADWGYIKIAQGRDACDCPSNRGRMYCWTQELMSVKVKVEEIR